MFAVTHDELEIYCLSKLGAFTDSPLKPDAILFEIIDHATEQVSIQ